jgi:hypothetical protein
MQSLAAKPEVSNNQSEISQEPEGCMLGHELGDCPAKRAGCHSHLEMLKFMYPPLIVRSYFLATMADNAEVRAWLARLDAVLGVRPSTNGARL